MERSADLGGQTVRVSIAIITGLCLASCAKPAPPEDYRDLDVRTAATKFFDRGLFKDGMWNVSLTINSGSVGSLPDDGPAARAIAAMVRERLARQPVARVQLCLARANIDKIAVPGFDKNCRYESLHFEADGGRSVMTCTKSPTMDEGTSKAEFKALENGFQMDTTLDAVTDLGGMGKPRPKVASMTAVWTFAGPCTGATTGG